MSSTVPAGGVTILPAIQPQRLSQSSQSKQKRRSNPLLAMLDASLAPQMGDLTGLAQPPTQVPAATLSRALVQHNYLNFRHVQSQYQQQENRGLRGIWERFSHKRHFIKKVVRRFTGVVERMDEQFAYVTMGDQTGKEYEASLPATTLQAHGIHSGDQFTYTITRGGGGTYSEFQRLPRRVVPPARAEELRRLADVLR